MDNIPQAFSPVYAVHPQHRNDVKEMKRRSENNSNRKENNKNDNNK